jgi:hypothetical protein
MRKLPLLLSKLRVLRGGAQRQSWPRQKLFDGKPWWAAMLH